jgi:hypothetical protein
MTMATDYAYDETPTRQGTFADPVDFQTKTENPAGVILGFRVMVNFANLLFEAEKKKEIHFKPGTTAMILEMMGLLLMRAAHLTEDKRPIFFTCWAKAGPVKLGQLIASVKGKGGLLAPEDLAVFLGCLPPSGD